MKSVEYEFTRQKIMPGFDGKTCKVCPSICKNGDNVLIAYQHNLLSGSDVELDKYIIKSTDGGKTFSHPVMQKKLSCTYENRLRRAYSGTIYYNKFHDKWFMLGVSSIYEDDKSPVCINGIAVAKPIYCNVDEKKAEIVSRAFLEFPFEYVSAYSMGGIVELENGDILVPFNYTDKANNKSMVVTVRYTFDNNGLKIIKAGMPIVSQAYERGFCEPSLTKFNGKYFMTIRTDEVGLYALSDNGYDFSEPKPYIWDDGSVLENYNTQQHWIQSEKGLFLTYTRKGAHNDHVFRHRAPIFMTRFDEKRECLIRDEEVILVPELGARLGNFCTVDVSEDESWLVTAEWMQSWNEELGVCEKYGSDNSIWIARIMWKR